MNSRGDGHRKNSGEKQQGGSATVIAIGALIDGILESAAIGISLTGGGKISAVSAAGAILTMLASTMMLEAYEEGGEVVGLVTSTGFLLAFILSRLE
ncbi:MAG TPA: hypothetical protein VNA27_15005 [Rubrobacteraceae bacterium]|nr:hypothetical protein [Rubrobacteraceae bacterium]